ncbi:hypothetical protein PNEG_01128 [Pneumocystis murina B123]|uniref:UBC core domain-containing protein n=1 Tax=Pneumocystis murina (strain B123) TaxID=1069680 RepID=M7NNY3_PNEMU|nr:hypothetical protein PNEG_01128 [Pneumocystis murina B123]EMR10413.1 hypothetical protein PNEG_01128 [Pneumocystis murina B123]
MALPRPISHRIAKEIQSLWASPLEGVRLLEVGDSTLTEVQAYIFGPGKCGAFKLRLQFGTEYPSVPPKCHFITKIFHPNVSSKGEVCVSILKKDWSPTVHVSHILLTVKCLLIHPNPESALNEEAGRLLLDNYESFSKHARLITSIHSVKPGIAWMELTGTHLSSDFPTLTPLGDSNTTSNLSFGSENFAKGRENIPVTENNHDLDNKILEKKKIDTRKRGLKRL